MAAKQSSGTKINPALKKALDGLLVEIMKDKTATLTDKMKVIDRSLKLAAIEAKIVDGEYGAAFADGGEDGND